MGLPRINGEVGKLWKDPEIRWTPQGKAVCELPLVFNKRVKNRDTGEWEDAGSMFVRGAVWEQTAENCANSLAKGDQVMVTGELSTREYEKNDGSKGYSLELRVYEVAVSLRWNEVRVQRAERTGGGSKRPTTQQDDPWGSVPPPDAPMDEAPF
jgi:single-strand DNA-binding protein